MWSGHSCGRRSATIKIEMSNTNPTLSPSDSSHVSKEFRANGNVLILGALCFACILFTWKALGSKLIPSAPGVAVDVTALLLAATVCGFLAEFAGAAYLYRRRKHGTQKKSGAVLVIAVMVLMLLPIQFSVLSIFITGLV